jgi:hypothetical protein
MLELKDYMDRGVQVQVEEGDHHLTLSGPDGVVRLDSFNVEKLARVLMSVVDSGSMVSVPRLAATPLPVEHEAVFTPDNPRPEEQAPQS